MALPIKPSAAVIGGLVGAAILVVLNLVLPSILPLLIVYGAIVLLAYVVGAVAIGNSGGEFFRGLLIGANAATNFAVAKVVFPAILGSPAGIVLAIAVSAFVLLSTIGAVSHNVVYQGLLGYLNWILPTSWVIVGLGFTFFLLCVIGALTLGLGGVQYFKISQVVFEWRTGTLFIKGGFISNLNPIDTAFNMGNFAFVDSAYSAMAIAHESGHTLNLAAFGSVFHLVGALDENVLRGANALSECLAESHVPGTGAPSLAMWT